MWKSARSNLSLALPKSAYILACLKMGYPPINSMVHQCISTFPYLPHQFLENFQDFSGISPHVTRANYQPTSITLRPTSALTPLTLSGRGWMRSSKPSTAWLKISTWGHRFSACAAWIFYDLLIFLVGPSHPHTSLWRCNCKPESLWYPEHQRYKGRRLLSAWWAIFFTSFLTSSSQVAQLWLLEFDTRCTFKTTLESNDRRLLKADGYWKEELAAEVLVIE